MIIPMLSSNASVIADKCQGTTEDAAKDIAVFVSLFFENFSEFKGRPFHMSGESYGVSFIRMISAYIFNLMLDLLQGRYLPLFASAVYDQNAKLIAAGLTPINLQSVMIGR